MQDYREGQTATNPKTGDTIVFKGGQWVRSAAPVGSPVPRKMSPQEQRELITQQSGAAAGREAQLRTQEILPAVRRLKPGPWRGAFLDAAIPETGGGIMDKIGSVAVGLPAKMLGAVSNQDVKDYQTIKRAGALATRQSETGEKGVQTEGDAARALLSTVTPGSANAEDVAKDIMGKSERQILRADFYTKFANRYGLSGVDKWGQSAEQAFQSWLARNRPAAAGRPQPKNTGVTVRRIK